MVQWTLITLMKVGLQTALRTPERLWLQLLNEMIEECDYEKIMGEYEQPICEFQID